MRLSALIKLSPFITLAACVGEPTAPARFGVSISVQAGGDQFGLTNATLAEPLRVFVFDPVSQRPVQDATVQWRVVSGSGATVAPIIATTGSNGLATANARLGSQQGSYLFEATTANLAGAPARFSARAVERPSIASLSPRPVFAGDTVTITGTNFSTMPNENAVLFSTLRGTVLSATSTRLSVVVPACVPARNMNVTVGLGAVFSLADTLTVLGAANSALDLQRGQVRVLRDSADLACQHIATQSGAAFLVVPQNASEVIGSLSPFQLTLLFNAPLSAIASTGFPAQQRQDYGSVWELGLRARERAFHGVTAPAVRSALRGAPPQVGERRQFKVFDRNERFVTVTAEVKTVSQHAVIYQDLTAPANGFTTAQFQQLGSAFDSPSYEVDVSVFGTPSDIDNNGQVIILLTPVVNELTPRGATGFVAGFFFGCDLQAGTLCSGSNAAEMFYLFVPDPTGKHGDARSPTQVLSASLPVLAHEFQHMISFGARKSLDALWLSEGLAHMAEDLVADEYRRRGDHQDATLFTAQNYTRAAFFLRDTTARSLLSEELPGSLEQRGAAWLLVKYLAGHYGGTTLLRTLARNSQSSIQNITAATGQSWNALFSDWSLALWADDAPELGGVQVDPRYTFPNINLRTAIQSNGSYALKPVHVSLAILGNSRVLSGKLEASAQRYFLVDAEAALEQPVHLTFAGQFGGPFALGATPQLAILRIH